MSSRARIGVVILLAGLWATGFTPLGAFGPAPEAPAAVPRLKELSANAGRRITTVTIETSAPVAYLTSRPDPLTLLLDLRDVDTTSTTAALGAKGLIAGASVEKVTGVDGGTIARVRIRLTEPASHQVRSKRNRIYVDFDSAFPLGSLGRASTAAAARTPASPRFATTLEQVKGESKHNGASITLTGDGELFADSVTPMTDGTPRVVLEFPNVRSKVPADVFVGRGPVSVVHVTTTGVVPTTRVVVDLMRPASFRVIPPEDGQKEFTMLFEDEVQPDVSAALDAAGARAPAQTPSAGATAQLPPAGGQVGQNGPQRFTGHPVSLNFEGADLRSVLRTFADISGLNIVIDQSVQGAVDVLLNEVPWDQALDIILRDHKLGYSVEGTIVRIAPLTVLADEEAQRRKLSEERAMAGELQVFTRRLSYAKAMQLRDLLTRTALSQRGEIQIHEATNTLIIRDLPINIELVSQLLGSLDSPEPQVEIEARIVTTTRDFARRIGVQWGFSGRIASDLGNTTSLAFPNQGSLSGRTGGVQGANQGAIDDHTSTAINLPVGSASSAIGLALGSVNGAFNLDVALSALEESGNGRILSTPRVATQNNVAAEITQGVQIPIQTVANNTVTVTFRDAALKLNVIPQITAANTVIMQVTLENSSPDFSRAVAGIPPINTQRAVTSLLVSDGQTAVIGGIYVNARDSAHDRTPGLHNIPLLGWLFQRKEFTEESRELLIFITPRIIKS